MEFTVREIPSVGETKSLPQREAEIIAAATEEPTQGAQVESASAEPADDGLDEGKVLSYLSKRYNKEIKSFDELSREREESEPLPEDVSAFLTFKKETGRGIQDFIKLQADYESMDPDAMLKSYLRETEEGLDDDDIDAMMDDYSYDEELDDETTVKKAKLAKKKMIAKAKSYFAEQKEKYKVPLESSRASIPDAEREEYESYKQYMQQSKTLQEEQERKRQWFSKKTDELFSQEFKGFEFNVKDKKIVFSPGTSSELKSLQSNPSNFISKYLDESGLIKDAAGYHKALSVAMNPEKFAQFFYEQGMADAADGLDRKIKNINMSERQTPQFINKGGVQIREVNPSHGRGLKIRSAKKV
jgi:hypothetical protein